MGSFFSIPAVDTAPIPVAAEALPARSRRSPPPPVPDEIGVAEPEHASSSAFDNAPVSSAYRPETTPHAAGYLPRIRPRAGFWSDVGWTLLFFVHPHNLVSFVIVWVLLCTSAFRFIPSVALGALLSVASLIINLYMTAWCMNIIGSTAAGDDELPNFAAFGGFWDEVLIPCVQYVGTWALLLLPAFLYVLITAGAGGTLPSVGGGLSIFRILQTANVADSPFLVLVAVGTFLWPIAILCVSLGGLSALARIDLIVVAVAKTLAPYTAVFVLVSMANFLPGFIVQAAAGPTPPGGATPAAGAAFGVLAAGVGLYFSIVSMRLIGLYYLHFKGKFPWDWE